MKLRVSYLNKLSSFCPSVVSFVKMKKEGKNQQASKKTMKSENPFMIALRNSQ